MKFVETLIAGVVRIELEPKFDDRGSFARVLCKDEFAAAYLPLEFAQGSVSRNIAAGTLRGMHMQLGPYPEAKIVRCTRGRVQDVVLDLRPGSSTYRRWIDIDLSADNGRAVFIPVGCAHGFLTLEPESDLLYFMTVAFDPQHQHGFRWNDPAFAINWLSEPSVISDRDRSWPDYDRRMLGSPGRGDLP